MKKQPHNTPEEGRSKPREAALRVVALFEGAKGAIVLLTGCGLLLLIHKDLHQAAATLIRHLHFNPASKYPRIFLDLVGRTSDANLWGMALAAIIYSVIRFAEAVGLWLNRRWAEWFGLLTGGLYLPVELFELAKGLTWPRVTVFVINAFVVLYLLYVLSRRPKADKRGRRTRR